MKNIKAKIQAATNQDEVWQLTINFARELGFERVCTHYIRDLLARGDGFSELIQTENIPAELTDAIAKTARHDDPIFAKAVSATQAFRISSLPTRLQMTQRQQYHFDKFVQPLGDGFVVPAFGPTGRCGYTCYLGSHDFIDKFEREDQLDWFTQTAILRLFDFDAKHGLSNQVLSRREIEILEQIARGRTNAEISRELDISPHSVNTYLNRCFKKLNVNDRTSAVLVAQRHGVFCS